MAIGLLRVSKRSIVVQGAVILGAWVLVSTSGCAQRRCYRAGKLPAELIPPAATNVEATLTSRLAHYKASSELIDRGDMLDLTIDTGYGDEPARTTPMRVADDGTVRIPLVGSLALAGLRLEDAERAVYSAAVERGVYPDPCITVEMKQQRMNRVKVIGAVAEPGVKELPRSSSYLLDALVAAGNLAQDASSEIEIRRPVPRHGPPGLLGPQPPRVAQAELTSYTQPGARSPQIINVNLNHLAEEGQEAHYLEDGDVVVVKAQEPRRIHVLGLVEKPSQFDLPVNQDVHLLDALAMAGGRTTQLADKVWIIRRYPDAADPALIQVSVREAKRNAEANVRLAANDVISVEETPTTFMVELIKGFVRVGLPISVF